MESHWGHPARGSHGGAIGARLLRLLLLLLHLHHLHLALLGGCSPTPSGARFFLFPTAASGATTSASRCRTLGATASSGRHEVVGCHHIRIGGRLLSLLLLSGLHASRNRRPTGAMRIRASHSCCRRHSRYGPTILVQHTGAGRRTTCPYRTRCPCTSRSLAGPCWGCRPAGSRASHSVRGSCIG